MRRGSRRTPLEIARERVMIKTCKNCEKREVINGCSYCGESGKILLPQFLDNECKYERIKRNEKKSNT